MSRQSLHHPAEMILSETLPTTGHSWEGRAVICAVISRRCSSATTEDQSDQMRWGSPNTTTPSMHFYAPAWHCRRSLGVEVPHEGFSTGVQRRVSTALRARRRPTRARHCTACSTGLVEAHPRLSVHGL